MMKTYALKHILFAIPLMGLFVAPFGIILAAMGEREIALWVCGGAFASSVVLGVIALRVLSQSDTRKGV